VADEGREFAFAAGLRGKDITKWSYRFEPEGGGTRVTESFETLNDVPGSIVFAEKYLMRIKDRRADLIEDMQSTLGRIKAAVEGSA
jgi:hypothetical protein